jgi:hypothetical protein
MSSFSERQRPGFVNWLSGRSTLFGSERHNSYKAFNKDPQLQQRVIKMSPYFSGALSNIYKSKNTAELTRISNDILPFYANELDSLFKNVKTSSQATDSVADFIKLYTDSIRVLVNDHEQYNRDENYNEDSSKIALSGKPVLRQRFIQPGQDTARESMQQSVSDVVQSDLFSYNTTNVETGINNSIYLDNMRHEYILSRSPGLPRPPQQLEQLVLPFEVLEQYNDQQPIEKLLQDDAQTIVAGEILRAGPPLSFALNDASLQIDPFQLRTQVTFMTNVNSLQPSFQRDFTQSTEFGENEFLGMRSINDTLRYPREAQDNTYFPPIPREVSLMEEERGIGFDVLY